MDPPARKLIFHLCFACHTSAEVGTDGDFGLFIEAWCEDVFFLIFYVVLSCDIFGEPNLSKIHCGSRIVIAFN